MQFARAFVVEDDALHRKLIDGLSIVSHGDGTSQQVVGAQNRISHCGCV